MRIPKTVWAAALGFALLCGGPAALAKAPAKGKVPAESRKIVKPGEKRGFNPQPEPPANPKTRVRTQRKPAKPGGAVRDDMQKMDDAPVEKVRARGR